MSTSGDAPLNTLHVLHDPSALPALRRLWSAGDSLLLAGAAVTLACRKNADLPSPCLVCVEAVRARGLSTRLPAHMATVDAAGWVALAVAHARSVSWS